MICSSLNRLRLMRPSPLNDGLYPFLEELSGLRSVETRHSAALTDLLTYRSDWRTTLDAPILLRLFLNTSRALRLPKHIGDVAS